jgi:hypothetical protein
VYVCSFIEKVMITGIPCDLCHTICSRLQRSLFMQLACSHAHGSGLEALMHGCPLSTFDGRQHGEHGLIVAAAQVASLKSYLTHDNKHRMVNACANRQYSAIRPPFGSHSSILSHGLRVL